MTINNPINPVRAFTLIEILVALVICGILLGALFSLFFGVLLLRNKSFDAIETGQPRDQVTQIISRDLINAVVPSGNLAGEFIGHSTGNSQGALSFHSTSGVITDQATWPDILKIDYYLETPTDRDSVQGSDFIRKVTRNLLTATVEEETDATPWRLLRGIKSLQFEYWDGAQWLDSWDSSANENENPKTVRMRIEFIHSISTNQIEAPLEIVCEIAARPRPTPAAAANAAGVNSAQGGRLSTGSTSRMVAQNTVGGSVAGGRN